MRSLLLPLCLGFFACSSDGDPANLGSPETWDVTTDDDSGVVHLDSTTMDFRIGELSGELEVADDGQLKLTLRDQAGATRYEGRRTGGSSLDLGVTSLSVGGTWTLDSIDEDVDSHLRLSAASEGVDVSCDGDCQDVEGLLSVVRDESGSGEFGDANGTWNAKTKGEKDPIEVRIEGSKLSFTTKERDVATFRWDGDEMSGTIGDETEFSAVRR